MCDNDDGLLNSSKAVDDRLFSCVVDFYPFFLFLRCPRTHNSSSSSHAEKKSFVALKLCGCHPKKITNFTVRTHKKMMIRRSETIRKFVGSMSRRQMSSKIVVDNPYTGETYCEVESMSQSSASEKSRTPNRPTRSGDIRR